jgi:outer membrane phospholipase A
LPKKRIVIASNRCPLGALPWAVSIELQDAYPLHRWFPGVARYFMLQAFSGYGKYLLNYNKCKDLVVRMGYTIAR